MIIMNGRICMSVSPNPAPPCTPASSSAEISGSVPSSSGVRMSPVDSTVYASAFRRDVAGLGYRRPGWGPSSHPAGYDAAVNLDAYFARIGWEGGRTATRPVLEGLLDRH